MEIKEFIEKVAEAIEIENVETLTPETKFRDLKEWGSLSVMFMTALYDEEFGKEIGGDEIKQCQTLQDLYKLAVE